MPALQKIQDGFFEHIGSTIVLAIVSLLTWLFASVVPPLVPVIRQSLSVEILLAVLGVSLLLNFGLLLFVVHLRKGESKLKLKHGILWDEDKNPHCPVCKNPGLHYGEWGYQSGYRCNPCNKTYPLTDASGRDLNPTEVLNSL